MRTTILIISFLFLTNIFASEELTPETITSLPNKLISTVKELNAPQRIPCHQLEKESLKETQPNIESIENTCALELEDQLLILKENETYRDITCLGQETIAIEGHNFPINLDNFSRSFCRYVDRFYKVGTSIGNFKCTSDQVDDNGWRKY